MRFFGNPRKNCSNTMSSRMHRKLKVTINLQVHAAIYGPIFCPPPKPLPFPSVGFMTFFCWKALWPNTFCLKFSQDQPNRGGTHPSPHIIPGSHTRFRGFFPRGRFSGADLCCLRVKNQAIWTAQVGWWDGGMVGWSWPPQEGGPPAHYNVVITPANPTEPPWL